MLRNHWGDEAQIFYHTIGLVAFSHQPARTCSCAFSILSKFTTSRSVETHALWSYLPSRKWGASVMIELQTIPQTNFKFPLFSTPSPNIHFPITYIASKRSLTKRGRRQLSSLGYGAHGYSSLAWLSPISRRHPHNCSLVRFVSLSECCRIRPSFWVRSPFWTLRNF